MLKNNLKFIVLLVVFASFSSTTNAEMLIASASQELEGMTQEKMTLKWLKSLENYTRKEIIDIAQKSLADQGRSNVSLGKIQSESSYLEAQGKKLAIIRIFGDGHNQVYVTGIVKNELRRTVCSEATNEKIQLTGKCGAKVKEVFELRL